MPARAEVRRTVEIDCEVRPKPPDAEVCDGVGDIGGLVEGTVALSEGLVTPVGGGVARKMGINARPPICTKPCRAKERMLRRTWFVKVSRLW